MGEQRGANDCSTNFLLVGYVLRSAELNNYEVKNSYTHRNDLLDYCARNHPLPLPVCTLQFPTNIGAQLDRVIATGCFNDLFIGFSLPSQRIVIMASESEDFLGITGTPQSTTRPAALWNIASIILPLSGLLACVIVCSNISQSGGDSWGFGRLAICALIILGTAVLGLICSIIAFTRCERLWGITAVGFLLNLLPCLFLLFLLSGGH
ncbi:MAG: hypothetical protein RLZZ350_1387, partial [Verrucomicrobiota bacterium]